MNKFKFLKVVNILEQTSNKKCTEKHDKNINIRTFIGFMLNSITNTTY